MTRYQPGDVYRCGDVCSLANLTATCCESCHQDGPEIELELTEAGRPKLLIMCCTVYNDLVAEYPELIDDFKPAPWDRPCPYGDPTCPCQDGDPCHYTGPNPMTPPGQWSFV